MRFRLWLSLLLSVVGPCWRAAASDLVWADEFAQPPGSAPDAEKWSHELGSHGFGNQELQTYTADPANAFVTEDPEATDGKALVLRALQVPAGGYTSARLKTKGKFAVRYGRIEARLKLPCGQGIWPAFWMLGVREPKVDWPECGEIDIMENIGREPATLFGTIHGPGYSGDYGIQGRLDLPGAAPFAEAYHVYAVDWAPGSITWLFDGRPFFTATPASLPTGARWVFDESPFYLILNLAVGGHWPGNPDASTTFPQELRVDYVRVFAPASPAPAAR